MGGKNWHLLPYLYWGSHGVRGVHAIARAATRTRIPDDTVVVLVGDLLFIPLGRGLEARFLKTKKQLA